MKPSEVLLAARELVAGGWTKGALARDLFGKALDEQEPSAVCFCTLGAIYRAGGYTEEDDAGKAAYYISKVIPPSSLASWNDAPGRTHLDVVLAFERAALLAMKEGR